MPASLLAAARSRSRALVALVLALVGVVALAGCGGSPATAKTVDAKEWLSVLAQGNVTILDVRTPAEFAASHVKDAVNLDVEASTFNGKIAMLDKDATYVVYCHSGRRSGIATTAMAQAGFTRVYNLAGGLTDLQAAGATVVAG